ncbi:hypothetical protein [Streptomyces graminilatus]|nr:hypothetical protein [Streptomyces graminilatus]
MRSWVTQLAVLRQADLFVTHAGAGGTRRAADLIEAQLPGV